MMSSHTTKRMKSEALLPRLADREAREVWEKKGSLDTHARAMQRVNEILAHAESGPDSRRRWRRVRMRSSKTWCLGDLEN